MNNFSIAIDGPAGAGKSTIAKQLAKTLKCTYIDTGAMYRAVGYYCITQGINLEDELAVSGAMGSINIDLTYKEERQCIFLNKEDITEKIRTQEVATSASQVATYKVVREALVERQRELAQVENIVMDGRDIGTVVLPEATLKVFLHASALERAKRRYKEYEEKGQVVSLEKLLEEIEARDKQDSTRAVSPLKRAEDAVDIDSTFKSIEEVVATIMGLLNERMQGEQ